MTAQPKPSTETPIKRISSRHRTSYSNETVDATNTDRTSTKRMRLPYKKMSENYLVIWLDASIDLEKNEESKNILFTLQDIVKNVSTYQDPDLCFNALHNIKQQPVFLIVSYELARSVTSLAHDMSEVTGIYLLCKIQKGLESWNQEWPKIKGVFTDIKSLCQDLEKTIFNDFATTMATSFITLYKDDNKKSLDELDPLFIYTLVVKEISLTTTLQLEDMDTLIALCQDIYSHDQQRLKTINEFRQEYAKNSPLYWYNHRHFIFSILNVSLKMMNVNLSIMLSFFIQDLEKYIARQYQIACTKKMYKDPFVVYNVQVLSKSNFRSLKKKDNQLISFNSFLKTTKNRQASLNLLNKMSLMPNQLRVLFVIRIDPSIGAVKFATIDDGTNADGVVFGMHSVFQIGKIETMEKNEYRQIQMTVVGNNDVDWHNLIETVSESTYNNEKDWKRLGMLLMKLYEFDEAEQLYNILLHQKPYETEVSVIYQSLAMIKSYQGKYPDAIKYLKQFFDTVKAIGNPTNFDSVTYYNNMGTLFNRLGRYKLALSYYQNALDIYKKVPPPDQLDLAACYMCHGSVYEKTGPGRQALAFYAKALLIYVKHLPRNHHLLAMCYSNIGSVYADIGVYSQALAFHTKALAIYEEILPPKHLDLATLYHNMGLVYDNMRDYSKALESLKKALNIYESILPSDHIYLAASYSSIAIVYANLRKLNIAQGYADSASNIYMKQNYSDHPDAAICLNNLYSIYEDRGDYSTTLSKQTLVLETYEKALPVMHPYAAVSFNNIGVVHSRKREFNKSLSSFQRALEIWKTTCSPNHLDLATAYQNIGLVYQQQKNYSKALSYYLEAERVFNEILPPYHISLADCYNNLGLLYSDRDEFSKALDYYEKALHIYQSNTPSHETALATCHQNIGLMHEKMKDYSKALSLYKSALEIYDRTLPSNHPDLAEIYNSIGSIYEKKGNYSKSTLYYEKAVVIGKQSLDPNDQRLKLYSSNVENVRKTKL